MKRFFTAVLLPVLLAACDRRVVDVDPSAAPADQQAADIYALKTKSLDGKPVDLEQYRGQVTLLVNVASKCGYTPQYSKLQKLQEAWKDKNFTVIAFPCNDFGGQEPGNADDIRQTCRVDYKTTFPVMSKIKVKAGSDQSAIYRQLQSTTGVLPRWNFGKYLVDSEGHPVAFFGSSVDPMSPTIQDAIKAAMNGDSKSES
ncbi:MAG: glutathione peroxidase [Phycisphaerae bacterium]|nr:glutathione peroxidase [Phycisphaerae bacterium]